MNRQYIFGWGGFNECNLPEDLQGRFATTDRSLFYGIGHLLGEAERHHQNAR